MSETALDHLASLQDKARAEKNAALVERCSHWAGVLRECAKRGPGIVFWGRPLTDGEAVLVSVPPDIQQQLLQLCAWSSRTELPQKITQLRTLIASLAPAGPPLLLAECQSRLGEWLMNSTTGDRAANIEEAIELHRHALNLRESVQIPLEIALSHWMLGRAYSQRLRDTKELNLETAIRLFDVCLSAVTFDSLPIVWSQTQLDRGIAFGQHRISGDTIGNQEEAMACFAQIIARCPPDSFPATRARAHINQGNMYFRRFRGDSAENQEAALQHFSQAEALISFDSDPQNWAALRNGQGNVFVLRNMGDPLENINRAIGYYGEALDAATHLGQSHICSEILNNLGQAHVARASLSHLSELDETELPPDFVPGVERGGMLIPAGKINRPADLQKAITFHSQALELLDIHSVPVLWSQARILLGQAILLQGSTNASRRWEDGISCFDSALSVLDRGKHAIDWASCHVERAAAIRKLDCQTHFDLVEETIAHLRTALDIFTPHVMPRKRLAVIRELAGLLSLRGGWAEALSVLQELPHIDDILRQRMLTISARSRVVEQTSPLYSLASLCLARENRIDDALLWLERGKARELRDRMQRDRALFRELTQQDRDKYERILERLRKLDAEQRGETPGPRQHLQIAAEARECWEELQRHIAEIRRYMPDFLAEGLSSTDLHKCLAADGKVAIVTFDVTEFGSVVMILAGRPDQVVSERAFLPEFTTRSLRGLLSQWQTAIQTVERARRQRQKVRQALTRWDKIMTRIAKLLEQTLFRPVWEAISRWELRAMTLIPCGGLHVFPLHLLRSGGDGNAPCLLDVLEVRYAPSLELLKQSAAQKNLAPGTFLGVCNPTGDLPAASSEVETAAKLFRCSKLLKESEATVANVLAEAPFHDVVHLACHGTLNLRNPYNSFLILAPPLAWNTAAATGERDGEPPKLLLSADREGFAIRGEAWALWQMLRDLPEMKARLVVLSACKSGLVAPDRLPDEYASLPAAFIAARTRAVISTLWNVDDVATSKLMSEFYRQWIDLGHSPARALQEAQRWLRALPQYEHYYYWGGFQFTGDSQPPREVG